MYIVRETIGGIKMKAENFIELNTHQIYEDQPLYVTENDALEGITLAQKNLSSIFMG